MIIVKMMGGLGNQMFQYALGQQLAQKRGTKLYLDTSGYDNMPDVDTPRSYELDSYKIEARVADSRLLQKIEAADKAPSLSQKFLKRLGKGKIWTFSEGPLGFNKNVLNASDNTFLIGWWQNENYFKDIRSDLLRQFEPKQAPNKQNQEILKQIKQSSSVSLHVRRGDYIANSAAEAYHGLTSLEYYKKAISEIEKQVDKPRFFVFSDDLDWCKKTFKLPSDTVFVAGNDGSKAYEDIRLMKNCKHNIIANSSFSWWGAWLNNNDGKLVFAPRAWFKDVAANEATEIVPSSWIRL